MFAVMGITGNVGGAVANTLLQHGKKVRGIVRDDTKAQTWKDKGIEVVTANYDDHLTAAFTGVEGVFCMIPPDVVPAPGFPDSVVRIAAIKKAVLAAKPPRAVFLSSIGGEKTSGLGIVTTAHLLEEELGSTGITSAFLRAGSFMENILHSIPSVRTTGMYYSFYQPLEDPIPLVATQDIGRIGAETLLRHGRRNDLLRSRAQLTILRMTWRLLWKRLSIGRSPALRFRERRGSIPWHSTVCQRTAPPPTSR